MNFNRSLGLTLVAAALVTAYGCGKEEPKKVEAPATAAAPRKAALLDAGAREAQARAL